MIIGLVGAFLTAAYMTRCVYLTFLGEYRGGGTAPTSTSRSPTRPRGGPRRRADGRGAGGTSRAEDDRRAPRSSGHAACAPRCPRRPPRAARVAGAPHRAAHHPGVLSLTAGFRTTPPPALEKFTEWVEAEPDSATRSRARPRAVPLGQGRCCRSLLAVARRRRRRTSSAWRSTSARPGGLTPRNKVARRRLHVPRGTSTTSTRSTRTSSSPASRARSPGRVLVQPERHRRRRERRRRRRHARPATGSTSTSTRRSSTAPSTAPASPPRRAARRCGPCSPARSSSTARSSSARPPSAPSSSSSPCRSRAR